MLRYRQFVVAMKLSLLLLASSLSLHAADLRALPEWFRPDPFGNVVEVDREGSTWLRKIDVAAARGGYISFHIVATDTSSGAVTVDLPLAFDMYREWFHHNAIDQKYYPDALVPVVGKSVSIAATPSEQIPQQTAHAVWLDIWIPASTKPGIYRGDVSLLAGGKQKHLPIQINVLALTIPADDALALDNNSYGVDWLHAQYPKAFENSHDVLQTEARLIHEHHRLFYENHGTFHQLGYSHLGNVSAGFAPELAGTGDGKHISDWNRFDDLFGPLLDGTAFRDGRREAKPVPSIYLPINAGWPANELWWGQPGYEAEFKNVIGEMERHFREKGWTHTRLEVFFNQKKRYKGFAWDGDEIRFPKDNAYLLEYARLVKASLPEKTPVQFQLRADSSWQMGRQFGELGDVVKVWTVGQGMFSWNQDRLPELRRKGDTVWTYGGTPAVQQSASSIAIDPMRAWIAGVDGFVRWLTVSPGRDPWFNLQGGSETLIYPGEFFGIERPLPSIRLKLQRNCLQDIALLHARELNNGDMLRRAAVKTFNGSELASWRNKNPTLPKGEVTSWNNADIDDALKPYEAQFRTVKPAAWIGIHALALHEREGTR